MKKKIKIISCLNPDWWYFNHIGEMFDVVGFPSKRGYRVLRHGNKGYWLVLKTDCEILKK